VLLSRGESPLSLPIYFDRTRFTINLAAAARLNLAISEDVASQAEILGIADSSEIIDENNISPIVGCFTIAIPHDGYNRFHAKILQLLGKKDM
jgi:hypothetical protein